MSVIVDTLYVDEEELSSLFQKYSTCSLKMKKNFAGFQQYELIIPNEVDEKYFAFLMDNELERASVNFLTRVRRDDAFHRWVMSQRRSSFL